MTDVFKAKLKATKVHSWRCMCSTHVWHSESILYTTSTQENKSPSAPRGSDSSLYCHLQHPRLSSTLGMRWRGGKIIRGWQPCDTPQQTSVLDAGTSVAQWWTQCKREKKKCDKKTLSHTSKIIAYSPHIQQHTHWTGHKAVGRTMVSTFSISFKSYTWQKNQKEKKKRTFLGGIISIQMSYWKQTPSKPYPRAKRN